MHEAGGIGIMERFAAALAGKAGGGIVGKELIRAFMPAVLTDDLIAQHRGERNALALAVDLNGHVALEVELGMLLAAESTLFEGTVGGAAEGGGIHLLAFRVEGIGQTLRVFGHVIDPLVDVEALACEGSAAAPGKSVIEIRAQLVHCNAAVTYTRAERSLGCKARLTNTRYCLSLSPW